MRVGMDFGTTNSGVAFFDGSRVHMIALDATARSAVMRSVIYLTREHECHVGQQAISLYNGQNINRQQRLVRRVIGHVEMEHSDGLLVETDVHILVDELEPGRLIRSLKSALATGYKGTVLYGREYTLEDLIALYLRTARTRASEALGAEVTEVVLGRPVHFVGAETDADDSRAEARLRQAAELAGFRRVAFEFEPVAAALHYARSLTDPQHILVYDFGGGTLDVTAMRVGPGGRAEVLAIGGVGIAGDRFDQRLAEHTLLTHFGADVTWGEKRLPVPRSLIEQITAWEGLPALATPETRAFLHRMQARCTAPARLYALESLIFNSYGFALFEAVEATKRRLSDVPFAAIAFTGTDIDIWQPVTRTQFASATSAEWRRIREAVIDVIARSGLEPLQIDAVVRTGGSSSIPASQSLLAELFGAEKVVEEDLFLGVTAGLSIRAAS